MLVPPGLCTEHVCFRSLRGSRERALVACGFMAKPGGWDVREEARPAYSAVLVLRGAGWYADAAGRRWPLAPGHVFQRFTGVRHSLWIEADPPWAECWIHLDAAAEAMLAEMRVIDRALPVLAPGIDLALVRELRRAVDALRAAPDRDLPRQQVRLLGMLLGLLGGGGRPDPGGLDVDRACRLLADDPRADLRLVARDLGLPYGRFRKAFRAAVGIGPGEYRLRRRLDRARAELVAGRGVAEVAAGLGYANPFTFTTLFRKHVGVSPSAWRRGAR